jgi:hypothetical protein
MNATLKTPTPPADQLLRRALFANALFSATSAALCLTLAEPLGGALGIAPGELFSLGIELGLFALGLLFLGSRDDLSRKPFQIATVLVIALDALWVAGSAVILRMETPLTTAGWWTVLGVALVVADVAFFQFLGLRRLRRAADGAAVPPVASLTAERA